MAINFQLKWSLSKENLIENSPFRSYHEAHYKQVEIPQVQ